LNRKERYTTGQPPADEIRIRDSDGGRKRQSTRTSYLAVSQNPRIGGAYTEERKKKKKLNGGK